jgi:hypothetical protein
MKPMDGDLLILLIILGFSIGVGIVYLIDIFFDRCKSCKGRKFTQIGVRRSIHILGGEYNEPYKAYIDIPIYKCNNCGKIK